MQTARGASLSTDQEPPEGTAETTDDPSATALAPRRIWLFGGLAVLVLALDLATKEIALRSFSAHEPIELLGGLLKLTLVFNSGAAFSIGQGFPWIFTIIATIVVAAILCAAVRLRSVGWATALGLVLGGAVGNLVDRFFRDPAPLRGHVIDWIQVPNWPVFNIADSAIVCGGILAVLLAFFGINLDGTRDTRKKDTDAEPSSATESGGAIPTAEDTDSAGSTGNPRTDRTGDSDDAGNAEVTGAADEDGRDDSDSATATIEHTESVSRDDRHG